MSQTWGASGGKLGLGPTGPQCPWHLQPCVEWALVPAGHGSQNGAHTDHLALEHGGITASARGHRKQEKTTEAPWHSQLPNSRADLVMCSELLPELDTEEQETARLTRPRSQRRQRRSGSGEPSPACRLHE